MRVGSDQICRGVRNSPATRSSCTVSPTLPGSAAGTRACTRALSQPAPPRTRVLAGSRGRSERSSGFSAFAALRLFGAHLLEGHVSHRELPRVNRHARTARLRGRRPSGRGSAPEPPPRHPRAALLEVSSPSSSPCDARSHARRPAAARFTAERCDLRGCTDPR